MNENNSGVLFKNLKKQEGSKQPDYTGSVTIEGVEKQLAAWVCEGKSGKFFSLKFSDKFVRTDHPQQGNTNQEIQNDSGDLPF